MSAVERAAERAADRWRRRLAAGLRDIAGVTVEIENDGIVARGRRLRARWLKDARLRWLGGWM